MENFKNFRIGNGYDVHRLIDGNEITLGGVKISHNKSLLGHSDADVLVHAIMDALLGACSLKDIGYHFPDTDNKYKGISSIKLLKKVSILIKEKKYEIINIDSIVIAQKPKLMPYIDEMKKNISNALNLDIDNVNIKATTTEKLGFEGKEEGISASAVVLCYKKSEIK